LDERRREARRSNPAARTAGGEVRRVKIDAILRMLSRKWVGRSKRGGESAIGREEVGLGVVDSVGVVGSGRMVAKEGVGDSERDGIGGKRELGEFGEEEEAE